jgi:hypothetical protein
MNANAETEPESVSDPLGEARFLSSSSGSCHGCFARIVVFYLDRTDGSLTLPGSVSTLHVSAASPYASRSLDILIRAARLNS